MNILDIADSLLYKDRYENDTSPIIYIKVLLIGVVLFIIYKLRFKPGFDILWKLISMFLIMLLIHLVSNNVINWLKEKLNSKL
jgi:hypothetical protein